MSEKDICGVCGAELKEHAGEHGYPEGTFVKVWDDDPEIYGYAWYISNCGEDVIFKHLVRLIKGPEYSTHMKHALPCAEPQPLDDYTAKYCIKCGKKVFGFLTSAPICADCLGLSRIFLKKTVKYTLPAKEQLRVLVDAGYVPDVCFGVFAYRNPGEDGQSFTANMWSHCDKPVNKAPYDYLPEWTYERSVEE